MPKKIETISDTLRIDPSTISICASGTADQIDREFYYPSNVSSGDIVANSTGDLGVVLEPGQKDQLIESLDVVKTYVSEMEVSFGPLKFKIKRSPMKKIIKTYKET